MKKNALIINTSRGEVLNLNDLQIVLKNNSIRGAALDVFGRGANFIEIQINERLF